MLELCLGALNPCSHVMLSQRSRLRDVDPFGRAAEKFLSLTPRCCSTFALSSSSSDSQTNSLPSACTYDKSLYTPSDSMKSLPATVNHGSKLLDSLYGNYHAYLCDARQKIKTCRIACSNWSCRYDGSLPQNSNTSSANTLIDENTSDQRRTEESKTSPLEMLKTATSSRENDQDTTIDNVLLSIQSLLEGKDLNSNEHNIKNELTATVALSLDEQAKLDADIAELLNEDIGVTSRCTEETCFDKKEPDSCMDESTTAMNSLMSLGESSGYESFAFKGSPESTPDNEINEDRISEHDEHEEMDVTIKKDISDESNGIADLSAPTIAEETSLNKSKDVSFRQDVFNGQPNVGTFLDVVLRKLECMTSNNLYVNLHLTGLISRLAIYPQPLLQSFLLNHSLVFQPSIRSLFQVEIYRVFKLQFRTI